jgi:hypothetical protein
VSVFGADLGPPLERGEWEWVGPALGEWGTVGGLVPGGYEAIASISHVHSDAHGLPAPVVRALVELAVPFTSTPDRACIGVWEGWGWQSTHMLAARTEPRRLFRREKPRTDPLATAKGLLTAELATLPSLVVPNRTYHVLSGPIEAVATMHDPVTVWGRFVPDLWWPIDRAWFVASDTDLEWTYVAGSAELVRSIEGAWPELTRRVGWSDPIG